MLDPGKAASDELVVANDVVGLRGKHSLDVVLAIAHDETVSFSSLGRRGHLLDLQALQDGYGEELGGLVGIIEDHADKKVSERRREMREERTHSRAPRESAEAAAMIAVSFERFSAGSCVYSVDLMAWLSSCLGEDDGGGR